MEFETQKKMENYYLLTLFPGLLEQKKRKEAEAWGVEKYIQDVKHFLCRICKQKMDFETLWKKTYKKCISLQLAMEMVGW